MSNAKAFLERIRKCDTQIDNLTALKKRVHERAVVITPSISQAGSRGSRRSDRVGNAAVEVADLERELDRAVCRYTQQIRQAIRMIDRMDNPDYIKLLTMRYIEYTPFDQIAEEMSRSVQGIFYMHGRALEAFEQVLNRAKMRKNQKGESDERTDEPNEYAEH